jgi:hypothetical protein
MATIPGALGVGINHPVIDKGTLGLTNSPLPEPIGLYAREYQPNLYSYHDLENLTREELFFWIAIDKTLEQLGGVDLAAAAAVLSGQPFLPTRGKFARATKGTSVASVVSRQLLKQRMPIALPTLTGASLSTLKITFTKSLGGFVGRLVPGIGWTILAYDVVQIIQKTITDYNMRARKEDRLW